MDALDISSDREHIVGVEIPPAEDQVHELSVLIHAHHPMLLVESVEEDRVHELLRHVADRHEIPIFSWNPTSGLLREGEAGRPMGTDTAEGCLAFIQSANLEAIFHLPGFVTKELLEDARLVARLKEIYRRYFKHRGALVITGASVNLPPELEPLFTPFELNSPTADAYHQYVSSVLREIGERRDISVDLSGEEVTELLNALHGLTFFEVRKIITQAVIEDGRLDRDDLARVLVAKRRIIERSGVLEYFPHDHNLGDIAGLDQLKLWLRKRHAAFADPSAAVSFGLSAPKGLLLIGVQGCGKSLCAKAVAAEWRLPLIRLDPSNLYQKFFGESEKNLRRAIRTAENMAPVVLWIDEIEKALGQDQNDGGTSQRVFGTFLAWMQEKKESVFVIATANDISKLPPELLRKGRFDEIFFVDLPKTETRKEIFRVHIKRRERDPDAFDLDALANGSNGFSGAEIEQAVVSALYTAFGENKDIDTEAVLNELKITRPLSVTMKEKLTALRQWASDRAVAAESGGTAEWVE